MNPALPTNHHPLSVLRQFVRRRPPAERCELCGIGLAAEHSHLMEPASRQLVCSCDACSILFSGQQSARYRRVPKDVEWLPDFQLTDAQWEDLRLPINLAFFMTSTPSGRVLAFYPSPAGATESLLEIEAWQGLVAENAILGRFEPESGEAGEPEPGELLIDPHSMDPAKVLRLATALGGRTKRVLLVGCEPGPIDSDEDFAPGLSEPVQLAVEGAIDLIDSLVSQIRMNVCAAVVE
jgi:Family of unknown function (DUF5947)/Hydrogenase maturation protease